MRVESYRHVSCVQYFLRMLFLQVFFFSLLSLFMLFCYVCVCHCMAFIIFFGPSKVLLQMRCLKRSTLKGVLWHHHTVAQAKLDDDIARHIMLSADATHSSPLLKFPALSLPSPWHWCALHRTSSIMGQKIPAHYFCLRGRSARK
jgi:hypothetical protein